MNEPRPATDPPDDPDLYEVAQGPDVGARVEGLRIPRRPAHGERGVLLVDRPAGIVYLLDADDVDRVYRVRDRRPLAGDPADLDPPADGTDHIVRAAYESAYDVIAAPWIPAAGTPPPTGQVVTP